MAGETLVIHPGALGDVLLTIPALRALRSTGSATVALAGQPRIAALLVDLGVADRALDFDALGLSALFEDDTPLPEVPALSAAGRVVCWFAAGDPTFAGRFGSLVPRLTLAPPVPPGARFADARPRPATDGVSLVWAHLLASIGPAPPASGLAGVVTEAVGVPAMLVAEGRAALVASGWDGTTPVAVVHPGAGGPAKRWPADGFARVLEALTRERTLAPVVHRGPADADAVRALGAALGQRLLVLDAPPLPVLAGALCLASLYLGNDSGVSHLAAAVGTPGIVLFTPELVAWRPWGESVRVVVATTSTLRRPDVEAALAAARQAMA